MSNTNAEVHKPPAQSVAGLLGAGAAERWERLELAQGLARMPDVVHCPRCSAACIEDSDNCAQCPKCLFAFCSLCNDSWHARSIQVRWTSCRQSGLNRICNVLPCLQAGAFQVLAGSCG